jgi:predicted ABC-type ATPase
MTGEKKIIVIAGPNGAGKTTFATEFLPNEAECPNFINIDLIAAGLNPFAPEKAAIRAGRIMLGLMNEYLRRGESFSFETTLSGRIYAQRITEWQGAGFIVKLFFLKLPNPELAIARVRKRVSEGGHNVPDEVVRRRFHTGLSNFDAIYKYLVDIWALYDNSGERPLLISTGGKE